MKKQLLAGLCAAMLCACCLGIAACGGSSSTSSAASGSASASSASESASAASESASASAASASAASESAAASSAAASASAASASASATAEPFADSAFTGTWQLVEATIGGDTVSGDDLAAAGLNMILDLPASGRGYLDINGQKTMLTWEETAPGEGTVTTNMVDQIRLVDDTLEFDTSFGGESMHLVFVKA